MIQGGIYRENWGCLGNQMEGSGRRWKVIGKHICQHCWVKVHVDRKDMKGKEGEVRGMTNSTNRRWIITHTPIPIEPIIPTPVQSPALIPHLDPGPEELDQPRVNEEDNIIPWLDYCNQLEIETGSVPLLDQCKNQWVTQTMSGTSATGPLINYNGWSDGILEIHQYLSLEGNGGNLCKWVTEWVECINLYMALQNKGKVLVSHFLSSNGAIYLPIIEGRRSFSDTESCASAGGESIVWRWLQAGRHTDHQSPKVHHQMAQGVEPTTTHSLTQIC